MADREIACDAQIKAEATAGAKRRTESWATCISVSEECPILHQRGKNLPEWDVPLKRILAKKEAPFRIKEEPIPHEVLAVNHHRNLLAAIHKSLDNRLLQFTSDATSAAKAYANIIACFQTRRDDPHLLAIAQDIPNGDAEA